jgi:AcrR family transcriptional regulator
MVKKDLRTERKLRRLEENKIAIIQAAEKIFAQKGYTLTGMDDIAEEAQFSKATLYRYFKSKSEIFLEIIFRSFEESKKNMMVIQKESMSAEDKLKEVISYIISYYRKKQNIARIFMLEKGSMIKILRSGTEEKLPHASLHPRIPANFKTKMEEISRIIREIIQEGIDNGEFRNVDAQDASVVFGAMLRGFYFRGPVRIKEYSKNDITELLHGFFLYGIKKNTRA